MLERVIILIIKESSQDRQSIIELLVLVTTVCSQSLSWNQFHDYGITIIMEQV